MSATELGRRQLEWAPEGQLRIGVKAGVPPAESVMIINPIKQESGTALRACAFFTLRKRLASRNFEASFTSCRIPLFRSEDIRCQSPG